MPAWIEGPVSYETLHVRIRAVRGSASGHRCSHCDGEAADWAYDHEDPEELIELREGVRLAYSLDIGRYIPLCRPCHYAFDQAELSDRPCGHSREPENTSSRGDCRTCDRNRARERYRTIAAVAPENYRK